MDYEIIVHLFAAIGVILSSIVIWNVTYEMRYKFKVKYLLRPKFKKGDYVLVPDRNNKPTLAQVESVSTDYKEKEIEYTVRPTHFGNNDPDYEYFDRLIFTEESVFEIWKYWNIEIWDKEFTEKMN